MKKTNGLFIILISIFLSLSSMRTAFSAPVFDIDFYGGDTPLLQGEYDTGTNLDLANGQTVSVDVSISGLETDHGLIGWTLLLEYGSSLAVSNLQVNTGLWPMSIRQPNIQAGYLTAEGLSFSGVEGDNLLLFSFELSITDSSSPADLVLWDFDKGGVLDDVMTEQSEVLDLSHLPVSLVTVNNVPIPGAMFLLAAGLAGLAALRKR